MRLTKVRVQNYRSIEDSGWVDIEDAITAFVGKNESGKTAFLQAVYRLNPIEALPYDEVVDFPSRLTRQRKDTAGTIEVCSAVFELSKAEVGEIESELGPGTIKPEIRVSRGYRSRNHTYSMETDETAVVGHLQSALDLPAAASKVVKAATTITELKAALDGLDEPTADATALATRLDSWREGRLNLYLIDAYLSEWLPKFVYFDEYSTMPGKVSIPTLIEKRDANLLERGHRALLSLLSLVRGKPEDFNDATNHERLIRELENAANSISDEVFEYWSQNKDLSVDLKVLEPEPDADPPLDQGPIFHIRVHNRRHRVTVPFEERSRGFVWFFSFLAYFSELEQAEEHDLILLLDEPGLSLHATAQGDLLRFMEERLAPDYQVLYTTHSPFMIAPSHLERARTVMDVDGKGTCITSDVFRVDDETVFPLQAALGYTLTQTLFLGPNNLLLEGPSDLIYLDVMTEELRSHGLTSLNEDWIRVPVGGATKLSTFVSLIGANQLGLAVLADASTQDLAAIQRLRDAGRLAKGALVLVTDITGTNDADIEDLFDPEFYVELVNRAYADELGDSPLTIDSLPRKTGRITKRIDGAFAKRKIGTGKVNHLRPALVLLKDYDELAPRIDDATRARFQDLAERINSALKA